MREPLLPPEALTVIVHRLGETYRLPVPAGYAVIEVTDRNGGSIRHVVSARLVDGDVAIKPEPYDTLPLIVASVPVAALSFWLGLGREAIRSMMRLAHAARDAESAAPAGRVLH